MKGGGEKKVPAPAKKKELLTHIKLAKPTHFIAIKVYYL